MVAEIAASVEGKVSGLEEVSAPKMEVKFTFTLGLHHLNGQSPKAYELELLAQAKNEVRTPVREAAEQYLCHCTDVCFALDLGMEEALTNALRYGMLGWTRGEEQALAQESKSNGSSNPIANELRQKILKCIEEDRKIVVEFGIDANNVWFSVEESRPWDIYPVLEQIKAELDKNLEVPHGRGIMILDAYFKILQSPDQRKRTYIRELTPAQQC